MAIKKIRMRPEGANDYADVVHPETSADMIVGLGMWGVTTGTNAYVVSIPNISALVVGVKITVKFSASNTAASTINVNSLGAKSITKAGGGALSPGNIKTNGVYTLVYDGASFQLQGEGGEYGTALASDVLAPKTISTEEGLVVGTIPIAPNYPNENKTTDVHFYGTNTTSSHSGNNVYVRVPKGYYDTTWLGMALPTLIPNNVKKDVVIGAGLGKPLTGLFTGIGTATQAQVLAGTTFSNNTQMGVAGAMVNRGAVNYTITSNGGQYTIPKDYHNGAGKVTATFANLVAGNVKSGVNIGGVVGSLLSVDGVKSQAISALNTPTTVPGTIFAIIVTATMYLKASHTSGTQFDSAKSATIVNFSNSGEATVSFMARRDYDNVWESNRYSITFDKSNPATVSLSQNYISEFFYSVRKVAWVAYALYV